jgi:hypothetical protein
MKENTMRHWWKRMLFGAAALAFVAGASPVAAATCGDLNNSFPNPNNPDPIPDGLSVADAQLLLQVVTGTHPSPGTLCGGLGAAQCGDLNASGGNPTIADLVILLNLIAGNPTLFPPCTGVQSTLACGGTLSGTITSNVRVQKCGGCQSSCSAFIDGTTFVQGGVTLSFDAGATVCGRQVSGDGTPSVLVFLRDSKINAPGTPCMPIVFTSDAAENAKAPGQWGGIVFNGRAPVNCPGGECLAEGLSSVAFGGGNANDSSGLMRFVRSEFGGFVLSPDNETNAITFNGVGRGSSFNNLQAHYGTDDGLEWFGGTLRSQFLVATGNQDDQLDWQLGYTGANQFGLIHVNAATLPAGGGLVGYEADNNENGLENTPRSNPVFCNVTAIGTKAQGDATAGRVGALLRRGTAGTLANQIIMDFPGGGVQLPDASTAAQACTSGALRIQSSLFFNNGPTGVEHATGSGGPACTADVWYDSILSGLGVLPNANPGAGPNPGIVTGAFPTSVPVTDYIPTNTTDTAAPDCQALQPDFFTSAAYQGAFLPGGTSAANWLISCPAPGAGECNWVEFDGN